MKSKRALAHQLPAGFRPAKQFVAGGTPIAFHADPEKEKDVTDLETQPGAFATFVVYEI